MISTGKCKYLNIKKGVEYKKDIFEFFKEYEEEESERIL